VVDIGVLVTFPVESIAVRVIYGSMAFLLTGDAESPTEEAMVGREHDLTAQVLQLGHHGSRTSTSEVFLDAVQSEVAIYSAGEDNQYGHPHEEVLERLAERDIEVYGTATHGTITVTTDGTTYEVLLDGDASPRSPPDEGPTPTPTPTAEPTPEGQGGCEPGQVDINSADAEELQRIIHIGPARAEDIIRLRPFSSVDDLTRVSGIGPARLADIEEQGIACVD
jgi:competence protein ComEC